MATCEHLMDREAEVRICKDKPKELKTENGVADCIIVGGGPSGLSCALILARARRKVILFDSGDKRNEVSDTQHAVLGADGFKRATFIDEARHQVLKYPTVEFNCSKVEDVAIEARRQTDKGVVTRSWGVEALTEDGKSYYAKKLVLATGVKDVIPKVEGLDTFWGSGIWVCLYCDGYEYNDQPLAAYGNGERGVHIALEMLCWSKDIVLFTDEELGCDRYRAHVAEKA